MIPLRDTIPSRKIPLGTLLIAAINVFIFVHVAKLPVSRIEPLYANLGLVPSRFHWAMRTGGAPTIFANLITPFTSMFLHGGLFHLVFNMWSLWIFGDNVEDKLG